MICPSKPLKTGEHRSDAGFGMAPGPPGLLLNACCGQQHASRLALHSYCRQQHSVPQLRDPRPLVLLCRPTPLLQFLHDARQQLLRAAALAHDTRKLPPLTQLVQPGGVLDVSATHARALQTTADELFGANDSLRWQRVQLFNVPDSLDVLSTGEPSPPHSHHCRDQHAVRQSSG